MTLNLPNVSAETDADPFAEPAQIAALRDQIREI
jgi:hypothetical protein